MRPDSERSRAANHVLPDLSGTRGTGGENQLAPLRVKTAHNEEHREPVAGLPIMALLQLQLSLSK
jgi:hypothetical protein